MGYIRTVTPLQNHKLFVEFESGSTAIIDLSAKLETARFGLLKDGAVFMDAKTDGDFVSWDSGRLRLTVKELVGAMLSGDA